MASEIQGTDEGIVTMLVDKQSGELFLYSPIGEDYFGDGITAEAVIQALDMLDGKRAIVRINSPGGDVFTGIAIYNALRRYAGGVDIIIDSLCASIASVIALAGKNRTSAKGSMWMIHRAMTFAWGNQDDIGKALAMLQAGDKTMSGIYSEATGKDEEEITKLMSAETWFTADEAVEFGLATKTDGVATEKPQVAAWFKNAPKSLYLGADSRVKPRFPVYRHVSALR
mgnify:CR=1 FL=1